MLNYHSLQNFAKVIKINDYLAQHGDTAFAYVSEFETSCTTRLFRTKFSASDTFPTASIGALIACLGTVTTHR